MSVSQARRLRYKDLRLSQLRSFCEVCELGGFAAAGEAMQLTTPAVWEQVRAMEAHYGVELLQRDGRKVQPTTQGTMLFEVLRRLLAEFDSIHEVVRQQSGLLPERLTLVSSVRVQSQEILRGLKTFQSAHPGIVLRIRHADSQDVGPLVIGGDADVGVMLRPGPSDDVPPTVEFEPVTDIEFLLVMPPDHALASKRRLRVGDIVAHALVLGRPEAFSRRRFEEVVHSHNLQARVQVALETSSGSLTLAAVREGLGIGIVACMPKGIQTSGLKVFSLRHWFGKAQVVFARKQGARIPPVQCELEQAVRQSITQGDVG